MKLYAKQKQKRYVIGYMIQILSLGGKLKSWPKQIVMIKNMKTVNLSQVSSRQRFHNMNALTTPPLPMYSPFSWNSQSQLNKQNVNQKQFQFVSQLKKIRVTL